MSGDPAPPASRLGLGRHLAGFVASGALAFATDAAILEVGIRAFDLQPWLARLFAIAVATVVAWRAHRRLTFAMTTEPTLGEFARFATTAWMSSALNYGMFLLVLFLRPSSPPFAALLAATAVSMVFSYVAMRYGVFRGNRRDGRTVH